ncbi:MAG TPA: PAS domain-containing protein [Gammaproteobacteria bacterium]|nr:PAS domain-containing protein [Gammaproteobacteria bacterium]
MSVPSSPDRHLQQDADHVWRPLRYLNLYRILLASLFVSSFFIDDNLPQLGSHDPHLFIAVSAVYLLLAGIASFAIHWRWLAFQPLAYGLVVLDIIALTLLMRASGGIASGLGMLLVVAIAGNSLLLGGRTSILFAAIATLAVLAEQVYAQISQALPANYTQAGILGATLFATAFLAHVLSRRIRESEELAARRGVDLANLAQLNQHVIQRMQSGIIVVDAHSRIRLMNESAWHMLGLPPMGSTTNRSLKLLSPELAEQLDTWRHHELSEPRIFRSDGQSSDLLPSMTALGSDEQAGTLIFLEDTARMAQQAQQMKLASLGRLTASIAHEIRNPLGAISHAEQLLAETVPDNPSDRRLLEIIHSNTSRVNDIIENVLQLSRRDRAKPENLPLKQWLEHFITEFTLSQGCDPEDISIHVEPGDITIRMDASQLHQILWNLCQNGLRYSRNYPGQPKLELRGGQQPGSSHPELDIIDHGPGIDPEDVQHIFEPFFTTDAKGSGLGLYIARELCEGNAARLSYIAIPTGGSCFRIEFADTRTYTSRP